jgi:hypothetical protein
MDRKQETALARELFRDFRLACEKAGLSPHDPAVGRMIVTILVAHYTLAEGGAQYREQLLTSLNRYLDGVDRLFATADAALKAEAKLE